jgi:hypothetical protein
LDNQEPNIADPVLTLAAKNIKDIFLFVCNVIAAYHRYFPQFRLRHKTGKHPSLQGDRFQNTQPESGEEFQNTEILPIRMIYSF